MKKIAWSLFTLISLMACKKECDDHCPEPDPVDSTCTQNLSKSLLAYYPFNGSFNDESGNGNNATSRTVLT